MYFWYKLLTYLFYPIAPFYLYLRKLKKKEDPNRFKEKLSKIGIQRNEGFLVWFHVASVGEAMSILPLVENCAQDKKVDWILLTSITLSSGKILEKKYKDNSKIVHQFLPLDVPFFINKFLDHWKPNLSIFIDSEIWPNLILKIASKKIPLLLFNARISEKTFKRWKLMNSFAKKIFEKFDLCIASKKESEDFLRNLGAKNIKNYGNLKFSNSTLKLNSQLNPLFLNKIKNRKVWCAASTHREEEILCAKTHLKIKKKHENILTIIIPRHIDRTEEIVQKLQNLNLKVGRYSKTNQLDENTDILIVDAYGESLKFYNISKNVFIGKSLSKNLILNSGQNPIEPAKLGCKIFHGPNVSNFTEIYNYLKKLNVTKEVNNDDDLSVSIIEEFQKNEPINHEITSKIHSYGQNIFNNVVTELKKYIK